LKVAVVEKEERAFLGEENAREMIKRSNEIVKECRGFEGFNVCEEAQAATSLSR